MFKAVLILTFIAVCLTLFTSLGKLTKSSENGNKQSNKLMFLRVGFSALLLTEIILYVIFIK